MKGGLQQRRSPVLAMKAPEGMSGVFFARM
jgi:hypothetical protein